MRFNKYWILMGILLVMPTGLLAGQSSWVQNKIFPKPATVAQADWDAAVAEVQGAMEREHILLAKAIRACILYIALPARIRSSLQKFGKENVSAVQFLMVIRVSINKQEAAEKAIAQATRWDELMQILNNSICPCDGLPMDTCRMASLCMWENNKCICAK
jgi:hypothetical protein